jgi:hypothetical protein
VLLPLENLTGRRYFFQKQIQFSQRNNRLHAPDSNIGAFLFRVTCVSSTQLNRSIWNKCVFLPLENPDWQAAFLSNTKSILKKKHAGCSTFKRDGFFFRDTCVLQLS